MTQNMLSTRDNPFNPFDDFDKWLVFDIQHGYNSCGLLSRVANAPNEMTLTEETRIINDAINQILRDDVLDLYIKVSRDIPEQMTA